MAPESRTLHGALRSGTLRSASPLDLSHGLPFSVAAARVQLKLLDSAIFKAEQELEASWAKACFSQCPVPYVDEEWGSPWAALVAQSTAELCSFREAKSRLLARMQEFNLDDDQASQSSETDQEEHHSGPRSVENSLSVMKDLLMQHLAEQAQLRSENHALVAQNAELRQKEALWQERFQQQQNQLEAHQRFKAQMEACQLRNTDLEKENAILKERCFQKDWCMKKLEEQMEKIRGDALCGLDTREPGMEHYPWEDDASMVTDLSSWVCIASSQPGFFLADVSFKTPSGQALQAMELCKGSRLMSADGETVLEVLEEPEEVVAHEILELWAGDVILHVVPEHAIMVSGGTKMAKELRPGDLVTVDGHPAALIRVTKSISKPVPAIKVLLSPDGIPPMLVTRRLSEESPFAATV